MIVYRLESPDGRGGYHAHRIWCCGPCPWDDDVPSEIWEDKGRHYAALCLTRGDGWTEADGRPLCGKNDVLWKDGGWFDETQRTIAANNGLQISVLDVSDADPFVTKSRAQVLFYRDKARVVNVLHPITLQPMMWEGPILA